MPRLVIASGNRGKIVEIEAMLAAAGLGDLEVAGMKALGDPPEIAETADSFTGNACLKAAGIACWLRDELGSTDDLVLADDSGICVHALHGAPGVRSARFAGEHATDEQNNRKLVESLAGLGLDASPAHYEVILALGTTGAPLEAPAVDGVEVDSFDGLLCVHGRCDGVVRAQARGSGGFGYDPHFWIDDARCTFAELSRSEKAARSHRGQALRRMIDVLRALPRSR